MTNHDKMELPYSPQDEALLIKKCLVNIDDCTNILEQVPSDAIFQSDLRLIYIKIRELFNRKVEVNFYTVAAEFEGKIELEQKIWSLDSIILNYRSIEYSIDRVMRDLKMRRLIMKYIELLTRTHSEEPDSIVNETEKFLQELQNASEQTSQCTKQILDNFHLGLSFEKYVDELQGPNRDKLLPGIKTYYPELDKLIGGFLNGTFNLIGARTHIGKTTFSLQLIWNILRSRPDTKVAYFSLEMTPQSLMRKFIAMTCQVPIDRLFSSGQKLFEEEAMRVKEQANQFRKYNIFIDGGFSMTVNEFRARARRLVKQNGVEIIFIDYLTKIKSDNKYANNHLAVQEVSKGLQSFALEANIPIVCLAQLRRLEGQDPIPRLDHFRESGSIEEDADVALMLHRYDTVDKSNKPGILRVAVEKSRIIGNRGEIFFQYRQGHLEPCGPIVEEVEKALKHPYANEFEEYAPR